MERKASAQISDLSNSYHFKVEIRDFLTQHRQIDQDVVLGKSEVAEPMWLPLSQLGGNHRANGMYHRSGIGRSISNMSDSPAYFSIASIPSFFLYPSTAVASFHQVASVPFAHQMLRALLWMRSSPCPRWARMQDHSPCLSYICLHLRFASGESRDAVTRRGAGM